MLKTVKNLDIDFELFVNADYTVHTGSCIKHQVHEMQDIYEKYGYFPNTYNMSNTTIQQLWWERGDIDYKHLNDILQMDVLSVSSLLQSPGHVVPIHRDTFFKIKQSHDTKGKTIVRAFIYLQDWAIGHFVQYENDGAWHTSTDWKRGDGFIWDSSILHLSANAGLLPKYTLQISGIL